MKKKILSFILAICLTIPCAIMLSACGNKSGKYYETTYPNEYKIVLRCQYKNTIKNQLEYVEETYIVCIEDGNNQPTYWYQFTDFGTDNTYASIVNQISNTNHASSDWSTLTQETKVPYTKYLDSDKTNDNELVNGTACVSYNYKNTHIEKISKDNYHLIWWNETVMDGYSLIFQITSFETTNIKIPV